MREYGLNRDRAPINPELIGALSLFKKPGCRSFLRLIACLVPCIFWLTAAYASGGGETGGHEGPNWSNFFWRSINFLVLGGALYWLLAKKTREFFTGRQDGIRAALAEAEIAREAAEKKFREYSVKLEKATEEIEQIGEMIRSQGLAEKERIIAEAGKAAAKMKEDTQTRIEQEFNKASQQLQSEAVRLSTQMAEELLKKHIQAADHEAMVKDYIAKVVNRN
jgi:F-type H+-transporting ATPase subunit b